MRSSPAAGRGTAISIAIAIPTLLSILVWLAASATAADSSGTGLRPDASVDDGPGLRIFTFPAESVGRLHVRAWDDDRWEAWTDRGQARGEVIVSPGQVVRFELDRSVKNWDFLLAFEADAFHAMEVGEFDVGDAELGKLIGLTGLRALHIRPMAITDDGLWVIERMKTLRSLDIWWNRGATDRSLETIARLEDLRRLALVGAGVSDAGLEHLASLDRLEILWLSETKIGDRGLERLGGLRELRELYLRSTDVSDACIVTTLAQFPNLKRLEISRTAITPEGAAKVREMLPNCEVSYEPRPAEEASPE